MRHDGRVMAWLVEMLEFVVFGLLFVVATMAVLWWCSRMYFVAIRKGLRPVTSFVLVLAVVFAGFATSFILVQVADTERWPEAAENAVVLGSVFLLPPVFVTVVVAALPRRNVRRAGARSIPFLFSRTARVIENALRWAGVATIVVGCTAFWWSSWDMAFRLLWLGVLLLATPALFTYYRGRAAALALDRVVELDPRPPVLYLRPFEHERDPFVWVPKEEISRYSAIPITAQTWRVWMLTLEQYLGRAFTHTIGPVVALGNPIDVLPPAGAARAYVGDSSWQEDFRVLAASAAALVMAVGWSNNLQWELEEIRRERWHLKLFVLASPPPRSNRALDRWLAIAVTSVRGVQRTQWSKVVEQLGQAGYVVGALQPPSPGSVISFDEDGYALLLVEGATEPEDYARTVHRHLTTG